MSILFCLENLFQNTVITIITLKQQQQKHDYFASKGIIHSSSRGMNGNLGQPTHSKASGKSNKQRTGMLLHKGKKEIGEVVWNQGSLNRSSGWWCFPLAGLDTEQGEFFYEGL